MSQMMTPPPISLVPDSAPFNDEQRAWLNGFLAGWLGVAGESSGSAPIAGAPGSEVAEAEAFPWHDPALPIVERLELANDKPLPRKLMAAMAQLDCGACGYVCQTYAEKIASGEETCLSLCSPGGKETSKALKRLLKESSPGEAVSKVRGPVVSGPPKSGSEGATTWSRRHPAPVKLLKAVNLNAPGAGKHTTHVELDLGDSGLTYEVGDSLGVWPTNCDELVDQLLSRIGAAGETNVSIDGDKLPIREALRSRRCLADVTEELLDCLAEAADIDERQTLRSLIDDDAPLNGCDVLDVLRRFPTARPTPAAFVASLSPLQPRLYSISSSPKAHPGQVHLTVGRVAWQHNHRDRKGVCSTLFADRLETGSTVPVFVQKSHGFTVPADSSAPMIMIGPGTGIAPFRAFLAERAATRATGRNWLFFGDRHEASDFLYRDELEAWRQSNLLTRLDLAFSRDGDAKVYVQDRMRDHAAELWQWLQDGASVFVCGDAKRMAVDVDRTLHAIVAEQGNSSPDAAKEYIAHLTSTGRYRRDVY